jgi:sialic acid synthase SpsE
MRDAFLLPVGFSDHTLDTVIPVAAVARGACMIEKHLTPDRSNPGPDHSYALEPAEFKRMVADIRAVEAAFGEPTKAMLAEEAVLARRASLRAARDIQPGEQLTADSVAVERRAGGVVPRLISAVLGQRAKTSIAKGDAITWETIRS